MSLPNQTTPARKALDAAQIALRDIAICDQLLKGAPVGTLASVYLLSPTTIRRIARDCGVPLSVVRKKPEAAKPKAKASYTPEEQQVAFAAQRLLERQVHAMVKNDLMPRNMTLQQWGHVCRSVGATLPEALFA